MKPLIATREIPCQSPRDPLWIALADTAQLNRAIGNQTLESEPIEDGAARYLVKTKLYGLKLEYEEQPFQWNRPESLSITRVFRNGPACSYTFEQRLTELADGGSLVSQRIEIAPRWAIAWPFLWVNTRAISDRLVREVERIDANLRQGADPFTGASQSEINPTTFSRTKQALITSLGTARADLGDRLAQFIAEAPDMQVSRIRPFVLADQWSADRRTLVSTCLEAVVAGMLDLTWDIICPSCRTVAAQLSSLSDLQETAHCHLCDISINVDLDRAVEATFRPTAAVRPLDERPYCIGGPFRTPHVVAQAQLPAGGDARLPVPAAEGRYRLFLRGGAAASVNVEPTAPKQVEFTAGETVAPADARVAPQGTLVLHDRLNLDRHVKLEHLEWASLATTAHYVSAIDSFRRLFSAEVLRPGLRVKVTRVALVFTDLTGSAAMYTRLGDAAAYCFVQEHFAALEKVIDAHGGAIVKTIGDAVMAVFAEERAAVESAIALQQAFGEFMQENRAAGDVQLCVGMNAGPSYLVNANKILDYFGQTVNIANRLQCEAAGGQIVLPAEIACCGKSANWFAGATVVENFTANLKGLDKPLEAVRLVVDNPSTRSK